MNLPQHLQAAIDAPDVPAELSTMEKLAYVAEQQKMQAVQPVFVKTADGLTEKSEDRSE